MTLEKQNCHNPQAVKIVDETMNDNGPEVKISDGDNSSSSGSDEASSDNED